jgi:hypothetical protein
MARSGCDWVKDGGANLLEIEAERPSGRDSGE